MSSEERRKIEELPLIPESTETRRAVDLLGEMIAECAKDACYRPEQEGPKMHPYLEFVFNERERWENEAFHDQLSTITEEEGE